MADRPSRRESARDRSRRGHPLQHREADRQVGWAERGTWANFRGAASSGDRSQRGRSSTDDTGLDRAGAPDGNDQRRGTPERAPGRELGVPPSQPTGNPRTGSQRGRDGDAGPAGSAGGQFGDRHEARPTGAQLAGYHDDDRFGGRKGPSTSDHRFGSRRGHGSRRRADPRTR